jgi:CDGSH-type Zn-finger protein/uncharacterized Fe-S cluster protein YjdI
MSEPVEIVRGRQVAIVYEGRRCIHSRGCVLDRPDVFVPNVVGPWIHPDAARPEEVAELAHGCPSGAIRYQRLDGGPAEVAPLVNTIRVRENGPLAVHARILLRQNGGGDGGDPLAVETSDDFRLTLCRCGQSSRKPFCDSSHKTAAFVATGEPADGAKDDLPARDGVLEIVPTKNGPLRLTGNVEICSGTGRTLAKVTKAALCRCGQSSRKPFCDGTHARVGFVSE